MPEVDADQSSPVQAFRDLYTSNRFIKLGRMGPVSQGVASVVFDNAAAEAFFSSIEWEVLSCNDFQTGVEAKTTALEWCYGSYKPHPAAFHGWFSRRSGSLAHAGPDRSTRSQTIWSAMTLRPR